MTALATVTTINKNFKQKTLSQFVKVFFYLILSLQTKFNMGIIHIVFLKNRNTIERGLFYENGLQCRGQAKVWANACFCNSATLGNYGGHNCCTCNSW